MSCLIRTDYYARLPVASAAPFRCGAAVSPMAQTSQSESHPTASHFRGNAPAVSEVASRRPGVKLLD